MFIQKFAEAAMSAVNNHSVDEVLRLWAGPAVYDSPMTGPQQGLAALAAREAALFEGFSDLVAAVEPLGLEESTGAALVRFEGTHDGTHAGLAPTGNAISLEMIAVISFDETGSVVGERIFIDSASVAAQLAATWTNRSP
ncbi:ester cyclase [Nocardioides carbamazepini]|uniref:ester cyclase n=1 Tax=Nocardioides carbamazepini TaxID=2854259 RepID=UPI002149AE5A|nr:ester cyclase [Nocardioides carbamazepini]MCR1783217.1 ester cyclase [Nocardioides carbamazepini]